MDTEYKEIGWSSPPKVVPEDSSKYMDAEFVKELTLKFGGKLEDGLEFSNNTTKGLSCHIAFPNRYILSFQGGKDSYSIPRRKANRYESLELAVLLPIPIGVIFPPEPVKSNWFAMDSVVGYMKRERIEQLAADVVALPKISKLELFVRRTKKRLFDWWRWRMLYQIKEFYKDLLGKNWRSTGKGFSYAVKRLRNRKVKSKYYRLIDNFEKLERRLSEKVANSDVETGRKHAKKLILAEKQYRRKLGKALKRF